MTVHDDIDNWLAADLHSELSDSERQELQSHLLDCADCRHAFQETKTMNQLLQERLEKPDAAFEQRMLGAFRDRVPEKSITKIVVDLMRLRSAQIAAVAAVLLALVQVGRLVTGERSSSHKVAVELSGGRLGQVAVAELSATPGPEQLKDRDQLVRNRYASVAKKGAVALAQAPPPPRPEPQPELHEEAVGRAKTSQSEAASNSLRMPQPEATVADRTIATGSSISTAEDVEPNAAETPNPAVANRKLIRNATVDLEIASFDDTLQKITKIATEERGYVATTGSKKQQNGKLKGEIVVKVVPENLDRFLQEIRGLGELKNQTLGTEDITKAYFDTDARLKNVRVMEQRLIDMLKKKSDDINDLLQVEKELGRVREEIEKMQGELKFWDSQVQFATVTISLAEKDLEEPAAFLLRERAQLSLYASDVEKTYNGIKSLASPKVQITNARLDRDNSGRVSARLSLLIVPEESEAVIAQVKESGRIDNFQDQTERVAQGGNGLSENAKTKRDKVELNITISRETDEQAIQETSLRILTPNVDENTARLKNEAAKSGAEVRNSTFLRDPDGREVANVSLRVALKNYPTLMKSLNQLGQVKDVSVQRHDRMDKTGSEENAPADLSIEIYSQGNIVSADSGLFATFRHTLAQGMSGLMWSLRMIGVAIAFLAPWVIALVVVIWIAKRISRARRKL